MEHVISTKQEKIPTEIKIQLNANDGRIVSFESVPQNKLTEVFSNLSNCSIFQALVYKERDKFRQVLDNYLNGYGLDPVHTYLYDHEKNIIPVSITVDSIHEKTVDLTVSASKRNKDNKNYIDYLYEENLELKEYLSKLNAFVVVLNSNCEILFINQSVCKLLDLPEANIIGENWCSKFLPAGVNNDVRESLKQIMNDVITDPVTLEYRVGPHNLDSKFVSWNIFPVYDRNNHVSRVIKIGEDISLRKKAEQESKEFQNQLLRSQKFQAIGELTSGVAHDFNNILGSINGFNKLAKTKLAVCEFDKVSEYLTEVDIAVQRARSLIRQMLVFSSGASEGHQISIIEPIVAEAVSMIRATFPSSIDIEVHSSKESTVIKIDPTNLHQVITNICINAKDAIERGGKIRITISTKKIDNIVCSSCNMNFSGTYNSVAIEDNGKGFDKEFSSKIFEPFFTTKDATKGKGMGLSVVHGILHSHNGHILAESTPGYGTCFQLFFPVLENANLKSEQNPKAKDIDFTKINQTETKDKTVVIIDDEPSLCTYLQELLEMFHFNVTTFTKPARALSYIRSHLHAIDLIIADLTMPEITGIDLAIEVTELNNDIPIILCTGYSEYTKESHMSNYGVQTLLTKPIDPQDLIDALTLIFKR